MLVHDSEIEEREAIEVFVKKEIADQIFEMLAQETSEMLMKLH